jgi:hypothetical protein
LADAFGRPNRQEDAAVTVRSHTLLAAATGLWLTLPLPGQEPARIDLKQGSPVLPAATMLSNQQLANNVAEILRQSGKFNDASIDVVVRKGTVELLGSVTDPDQRNEAVRLVGAIAGVQEVKDLLVLASAIKQAQALESLPVSSAPPSLAPQPTANGFSGAPPTVGGAVQGGPMPSPMPGMPAPDGYPGSPPPVPGYQGPPPSPYDLNPPKMPPYAWPTYAPYNNYSRVAYPTLYPYNAWPFVGPIYPFPKVPLGWRAVKLEWQDGYWWYSTHSNSFDWWRLRYW